jgi:hypothetical protein
MNTYDHTPTLREDRRSYGKPDPAGRRELIHTPLVLVLVMKQTDQPLHKILYSLHIV